MFLKGDIEITVELGKKEFDVKPVGVAFGNWFFGVLNFKIRAAELQRAVDRPEQNGAECHELHDEWLLLYNFCPECGIDLRPILNRSGGN